VEAQRRRVVNTAQVSSALERTLGPAVDIGAANVVASATERVDFVSPSDVDALVSSTPIGSSLAVMGPIAGDCSDGTRALTHIEVNAPRRGGGDPDRGDGALDRLARARARGAAHLVVTAADAPWLARHPELADHLARKAAIVACNAAGTLWSWPDIPCPGPPKLFVIGLPKTGTTSLHFGLRLLGLRSFHWGGSRAYQGVLAALRDGRRLLAAIGEGHDAYSDIETLSVRFDLADLQYPGSRFIFTVRDVDDWIASRRRHVERNERGRRAGTYTGRNLGIDEGAWRAQWFEQYDRVTTWFRGRDDLLVLDICAGDGWEQLAPFLDKPVPDVSFPRENVDGEVRGRFASWRRRR
jgi:hypothetical protein